MTPNALTPFKTENQQQKRMHESRNAGEVEIRLGRRSDAAELAAFGRETFVDTFGAFSDPDDLTAHLATTYDERIQAAELADPDSRCLVAEAAGRIVGYSLLHRGAAPECVGETDAIEIRRFYVARTWHGSGVADRLMRASIVEAQRLGRAALWLGVWGENERAIRFYRRHGFEVAGEKVFLFGSDPQSDLVMVTSIEPGSTTEFARDDDATMHT